MLVNYHWLYYCGNIHAKQRSRLILPPNRRLTATKNDAQSETDKRANLAKRVLQARVQLQQARLDVAKYDLENFDPSRHIELPMCW